MDLDKLLEESLKSTGTVYEPSNYADARGQFLSRSRRRRWAMAGATALAGAAAVAVVIVVLSSTRVSDRPAPAPPAAASTTMEVVAEIPAGLAPEAAAASGDAVWVAGTGSSTLYRIDPRRNAVVDEILITGQPDEIAVGFGSLWVTTREGSVHELDPDTGIERQEIAVSGAPGRLDLAVGAGAVWVASPHEDRKVIRYIPRTAEGAAATAEDLGLYSARDFDPTDVATGAGSVWALDPARSDVRDVKETPGSSTYGNLLAPFGAVDEADLAAGFGALWVALGDEGRIVRIDLARRTTTAAHIPAGDIDISIGGDAVWAVVSHGDPTSGSVHRFDPATGRPVGEALAIEGSPVDVAYGHGAAWVVDDERHLVSRVEVERD